MCEILQCAVRHQDPGILPHICRLHWKSRPRPRQLDLHKISFTFRSLTNLKSFQSNLWNLWCWFQSSVSRVIPVLKPEETMLRCCPVMWSTRHYLCPVFTFRVCVVTHPSMCFWQKTCLWIGLRREFQIYINPNSKTQNIYLVSKKSKLLVSSSALIMTVSDYSA